MIFWLNVFGLTLIVLAAQTLWSEEFLVFIINTQNRKSILIHHLMVLLSRQTKQFILSTLTLTIYVICSYYTSSEKSYWLENHTIRDYYMVDILKELNCTCQSVC